MPEDIKAHTVEISCLCVSEHQMLQCLHGEMRQMQEKALIVNLHLATNGVALGGEMFNFSLKALSSLSLLNADVQTCNMLS